MPRGKTKPKPNAKASPGISGSLDEMNKSLESTENQIDHLLQNMGAMLVTEEEIPACTVSEEGNSVLGRYVNALLVRQAVVNEKLAYIIRNLDL